MNIEKLGLTIACIDTACWVVCFWWMHQISRRQDTVLSELREQNERIEKLSKEEHELIKQVHPRVEEIKASVETVAASVAGNDAPGTSG